MTSAPCAAPPGTQSVLQQDDLRFLILGELHGTMQAPLSFAEIVCEAAASGPVIVGIERGQAYQAPFQKVLDSDGGTVALDALVQNGFDGSQWGLSSEGMRDMFRRLQAVQAATGNLTIETFQQTIPADLARKMLDDSKPYDQTDYEKHLAASLVAASEAQPEAIVVVLVGSAHASRETRVVQRPDRTDFDPMAMHLPDKETLSFLMIHDGGSAWNCTADGCGAKELPPLMGGPIGLDLSYSEDRGTFDGGWSVGSITAAAPVGIRKADE
ncbi:MAG: hypothetical protein AAGI03_11085 [Pseudomonadota bacterium]